MITNEWASAASEREGCGSWGVAVSTPALDLGVVTCALADDP